MVPLIKENQKKFMERKFTDRDYHVQDNADVEHKYVKMYCNTNQFSELLFSGPYYKPNSAKGLSEHYHLRLYQKLGMGIFAIFRIPWDCVVCASMIDKNWISGIPS